MIIVILPTARYIVGSMQTLTLVHRLEIGTLALLFLLLAELGVVMFLREQAVGEYVATRDSVSGTVYLLALVWFAVAPALVGRKGRRPMG